MLSVGIALQKISWTVWQAILTKHYIAPSITFNAKQHFNAEAYCHGMAHNPPTPSQLAYLRALGYYEKPANELDANHITIQLVIKVAVAPKSLRTLQRKNGEFLVEQPEQKRSLSKLYENLERLLRKRLIKIAWRLIWYIFLYHIGI